jgi:acetyl esterase/lipase
MRSKSTLAAAWFGVATSLSAPALAALPLFPPVVPTGRPDLPAGIELHPLVGKTGSAKTEQWGTMDGWPIVRNVTDPTLTPVLPPPDKRNGTAVIVAPGGGFLSLSMGTEGFAVAQWLAAHGTSAFVLKYRLRPTPVDQAGYMASVEKMIAPALQGKPIDPANLKTPEEAVADAQAAVKLLRARAGEYHINAARIGMIGFSAGAMTTLQTALQSPAESRPDFIAPIYPPMLAVAAKPDSPPMFVAVAADDPLFGKQGFGLITSWIHAGRPVEFHFYEAGSHGFGMRQTNTTSQDFILSFQHWMDMHGWTGQKVPMP